MNTTPSIRLALVVAIGTAMMGPARAGIPVIDAGNLTQNVVTATEQVAQTLKQVEQYATQLQQLEQQYQSYVTQIQQYENMVQNTVAPAAYIWNQAQSVMTQLRGATDTLSYYKNQVGSVDGYLAKFQDVNYYRNSPCYTATGCSAEDMATLNRNAATIGSESQKKANDAMFKGLDQQQDAMQADAARLEQLQGNAQTATGQMQAIGYASQLAAEQGNQLLQIRGLLVAQQNAIATKMQADADKEARIQAASDQFRQGSYGQSSGQRW
jgi:P-type conjugative transfer protein TrbJ